MQEEPRYEPERVEASADVGLRIGWADGHTSHWDLDRIREACACATCNELRRAGRAVRRPTLGPRPELDVVDAELIGSYGITFHWSDGHRTGVYRWEDLREGCGCDDCRTLRHSEGRSNPLDRKG